MAFPLAGAARADERADRETLQRRLGDQGVVDLDRRSGTPRVLARLDGTLTRPSSRPAEAVALDYVRSNRSVLGLTAADLDALSSPSVDELGGVTSVAWRQTVDGIPASDHSLRVNVAGDGRVLSVVGAPAHALDVDSTAPVLSAGEAVRAVQDDVGVHRSVVRRSGTSRRVNFGNDTSATVVILGGRLAWRVQYRAGDDAVYDATVDARTGKVLRRVNMVKADAPALVWERFPGTLAGGNAVAVDLEERGWLAGGANTLDGPNVRAYSDVDDSDTASASEEVTRTGGGFSFPLVPASGSACDAEHLCMWTGSGSSWQGNREQDTVQAFYFANRFHDHLAALGFDAAAGAFEGTDKLVLNTLDGAATGPDGDHVNNANMFTPPNGESPRMQMYLWRSPYRNISSGSDAAVLYHEYAHGLSNRLVTDADGVGALNSAQAGAMGEGWSDWYAQDFIVGQFPSLDTGAAGEVDMGAYTNAGSSRLRTGGLDCPVEASPVACPGRGAAGSGGYTYGDFGRIFGSAEVHFDGEIWAQTLWDVRTALGSAKARALVTAGMRLLPPEPSFLDARNGILLADQALYAGADVEALWAGFAARGMGFFAAASGGEDTSPAESFALPPAPDAPRGTISGRVTSVLGGGPAAGVTIGLGGVTGYTATTDADGRYSITGVPEGTYLKASAGGAGYDSAVSSLSVPGGATITFSPVLRRNWASSRGGATITASNGREYASSGCGPNAAVDQSLGTTWSTLASGEKYLVVRLPEPIDVTEFALDPAEGCGDSAASATAAYLIETSADGVDFTASRTGVFGSSARHQLNFVTPTAGATGVSYVRLTLLSSQSAGAPFRDMSEFGVYGTGAGTDTTDPETTLEAGGPPFTFSSNEPGTFECSLDGAAFAACTSPHAVGTLPDGEHTFAVRAVDVAGNHDESPASRAFTVDTTAPETTLEAGGPPFVFSSGDASATFECRIDEGVYAACTSPFVPVVADGAHTFFVRAVDAAGNRDPSPESRTFTVDSTAPDTDITGEPAPLSSDTTPTFTFTSSPTVTKYECSIDGAPFAECTSPHTVAALADGRHTFQVRAVGANPDPTPATFTFRVDTTPPETTIELDPPAAVHSGPIAFGVRADEAATFECSLDGGPYGSCATAPVAEALALGEHVYRARATDSAGNVDPTPAERSFTVVNEAPVVALDLSAETGSAPHTLSAAITATDADGDPLTYVLDFGDGETAIGALPAAAITHRYDAAGTYTARLTVRDARAATVVERAVTVTTAVPQPIPSLSLTLSAPAVSFGTFVPGLARDYMASLTAITTGSGTLTVRDTSAGSRGHLTSGATALAQPLQVRATSGAFAPLTNTVTIPASVEFKQAIGARDVLRPGTYAKALTFTLASTTP